MKRSAELQPLSREHNVALKLARDARRAAADGSEKDVSEAWRKLSRIWYTEMAVHFRAEEQLLFPILRDNGDHELVSELEREHRAMQKALEDPRRQDRARLSAIGHVLNDHIRREEREVFPRLERLMNDAARRQVQVGLDRMLESMKEREAS
ncbi:hemerythrin domain-containing protein [Natronospira bacteriovora]|uniref:Hemerythrin domain-containing protein n=1 Tax=Natronospira bacteriovora TaxID=3069753 RepID=A0ABU0W3R3_9GAMM|nr:hemerythrin domain-containing protein [Natronospira sp. AB-CW4]MDQ2068594.1 hemerythrin domain-containing protein [Natronospira sp. AB-CW4]